MWRDNVEKFKPMVIVGGCYEIFIISIVISNYKFKLTCHEDRLFLKNMTTVEPNDDSTILFDAFKFTTYVDIFKAKREDLHLIGICIVYLFIITCVCNEYSSDL